MSSGASTEVETLPELVIVERRSVNGATLLGKSESEVESMLDEMHKENKKRTLETYRQMQASSSTPTLNSSGTTIFPSISEPSTTTTTTTTTTTRLGDDDPAPSAAIGSASLLSPPPQTLPRLSRSFSSMADTKIAEEDRIALLHQSTEAAWAALQASSERAQRIRGDYEVGDETVVVQGILKSAGWTIVVANQELHHEGIEKKKRVSELKSEYKKAQNRNVSKLPELKKRADSVNNKFKEDYAQLQNAFEKKKKELEGAVRAAKRKVTSLKKTAHAATEEASAAMSNEEKEDGEDEDEELEKAQANLNEASEKIDEAADEHEENEKKLQKSRDSNLSLIHEEEQRLKTEVDKLKGNIASLTKWLDQQGSYPGLAIVSSLYKHKDLREDLESLMVPQHFPVMNDDGLNGTENCIGAEAFIDPPSLGLFLRKTQQIKTTKWADIEVFLRDLKPDPFVVVVKPIQSAGSDDAFKPIQCTSVEEVRRAFDEINGSPERLGGPNEGVLVQNQEKKESFIDRTKKKLISSMPSSMDGLSHKLYSLWVPFEIPFSHKKFFVQGVEENVEENLHFWYNVQTGATAYHRPNERMLLLRDCIDYCTKSVRYNEGDFITFGKDGRELGKIVQIRICSRRKFLYTVRTALSQSLVVEHDDVVNGYWGKEPFVIILERDAKALLEGRKPTKSKTTNRPRSAAVVRRPGTSKKKTAQDMQVPDAGTLNTINKQKRTTANFHSHTCHIDGAVGAKSGHFVAPLSAALNVGLTPCGHTGLQNVAIDLQFDLAIWKAGGALRNAQAVYDLEGMSQILVDLEIDTPKSVLGRIVCMLRKLPMITRETDLMATREIVAEGAALGEAAFATVLGQMRRELKQRHYWGDVIHPIPCICGQTWEGQNPPVKLMPRLLLNGQVQTWDDESLLGIRHNIVGGSKITVNILPGDPAIAPPINVQLRLKKMGVCDQGYEWEKFKLNGSFTCLSCCVGTGKGFRCKGGSHILCLACVRSSAGQEAVMTNLAELNHKYEL